MNVPMLKKPVLVFLVGLSLLMASVQISRASNTKNELKYQVGEVFLVSDENWQNVLKLVPLTTWFSVYSLTLRNYPTLIYHGEGNHFDADAIIRFLQDYRPSRLTIFGVIPASLNNLLVADAPTGAQLKPEQISRYTTLGDNSFLSFWLFPIDTVVISEDNYEIGLMASLLASHLNAPILFDGNFDYTLLDQKQVYAVGNISQSTETEIGERGTKVKSYNLDDLRKEYVQWYNTDKVILVNHQDLNIAINRGSNQFKPEKSASISSIYSKHSLAAPFLAAAKSEVIISTPYNTVWGVNNYVETTLSHLNISAPLTYLTIVANPLAIPMARENRDSRPALWGNNAVYDDLDLSKIDAYPHVLTNVSFEWPSNSSRPLPVATKNDFSNPAMYENSVVWQDYRRGTADIYMYDFASRTETRITTDNAQQENPAIYGNIIVWQDNRNTYLNEKNENVPHWDIYMYDLVSQKETRITTDSNNQMNPAIYENIIVWQDDRSTGIDDEGKEYHHWDIYAYIVSESESKEVRKTSDTHSQVNPAIWGTTIVWQDDRNGNWDIYLRRKFDLFETRVTSDDHTQRYPSIWGSTIVWEDNRNGLWDIYMYDIDSGVEQRFAWGDKHQLWPIINQSKVMWYSEGYRSNVLNHAVAPCADDCGGQWSLNMYDLDTGVYYRPHETIVADERGASFRQETDGRYYGSSTNWGHQDRAVGRIFGVTVADVSAYIARDLFFDALPRNRDALLIIREDWQTETRDHEKDGYVLETYFRDNHWTPRIRNEFGTESFYAGTTTGASPVDTNLPTIQNLYPDNYLIIYADHGGSTGFPGVVETPDLSNRSLLPSTVLDLACSTCDVGWGYIPIVDGLFCMENIRRGAMVYMGAVDVSYWHRMFYTILHGIVQGETIGEAYRNARNKEYNDNVNNLHLDSLRRGDPYYALIGDPTFRPRWW